MPGRKMTGCLSWGPWPPALASFSAVVDPAVDLNPSRHGVGKGELFFPEPASPSPSPQIGGKRLSEKSGKGLPAAPSAGLLEIESAPGREIVRPIAGHWMQESSRHGFPIGT